MNGEVEILEEPVEPSCSNCGVRYASGKQSAIEGNQKAQQDRIAICTRCEHHPNMAMVKAIPGGSAIAKAVFGEAVNNWRPITDGDKSCQTCQIRRTVNALRPCEESAQIVAKRCLHCKYSKNAALVMAAEKEAGIERELEDNWQNFEAV